MRLPARRIPISHSAAIFVHGLRFLFAEPPVYFRGNKKKKERKGSLSEMVSYSFFRVQEEYLVLKKIYCWKENSLAQK
jgi:hypothetical protein